MEIPEITPRQLEILTEAGMGSEMDLVTIIPDAAIDEPESNKKFVATQAAIDGLIEIGLLWDVLSDPIEAHSRRITMAKLEQSTGRKFRVLGLTVIGGLMFSDPVPEVIN